MRFRFSLWSLSVLFAFTASTQAQDALLPKKPDTPVIKPAPKPTVAKKSSPKKNEAATVITADTVEARAGKVLEATGNAEIRKDDQTIRADHLLLLQESSELFADGSVSLDQPGVELTGPSFKINMDSSTGEMQQPSFVFTDADVRGDANILHINGKQKFTFEKSSYTSCPVGNDDWLLKMGELELDRNTQIGTAYNARVEFMGVPMLYTPWMNFPLTDRRRTGLLGPVYGSTNTGGAELTIPVYLNISSNVDATLSPRYIKKRGVLYDNEFRYLGSSFSGQLDYGELLRDKLALRDRSHTSLVHTQNFGAGFVGALNLNQASDDAYFRDLSSNPAIVNNQQLLQEESLTYTAGGWWTASARAQRYQTLQKPAPDPLVEIPYSRLPQLNFGAQRVIAGGVLALNAEYVEFSHQTKVNGTRVVVYPGFSAPLVSDPAYFITPKISVHSTQYALSENNTDPESKFMRTVPIFSFDSGMTLERDFLVSGREYVQTLEPRIFYVNIPFVNQDRLPNFDTAPSIFSFVQMFTENRFLGSDRIGDADQITTALTSRLIDADNGRELLRVAIGERFSVQTPKVLLGAPTATTNQSDVLLSVAGRVSNTLSLDSLAQYNPNESRTEMFVATAQYRPEVGKVFNLGYRYTFSADPDPSKTLKQVDLSTQWMLGGHWHMVAQSKYSLQEGRTVEALAGLEYNQDCWALRLIAQQFVKSRTESSETFFIQLELKELVRLGNDPLSALKQSVPGYTNLTERPRNQPAARRQPEAQNQPEAQSQP